MSRATKIKYIVLHCTAGHQPADKVQAYFLRPKVAGGRGWNTGGYHLIIEKDGTIVKMYGFERITNGVAGHNTSCIHISYVGGVNPANVHQAQDTRTDLQKAAIHKAIQQAITWLRDNGKDITSDLMVLGHRDFSPDRNGNGIIESWERIKECPSCEAVEEYNGLYGATNSLQIIPWNR